MRPEGYVENGFLHIDFNDIHDSFDLEQVHEKSLPSAHFNVNQMLQSMAGTGLLVSFTQKNGKRGFLFRPVLFLEE